MGEQYEVLVELKQEVLDTEGRAILDALHRLGHDSVKNIRVSKRFVVDLNASSVDNGTVVETIASEVLANPVSQTIKIRAIDDHDQGQ